MWRVKFRAAANVFKNAWNPLQFALSRDWSTSRFRLISRRIKKKRKKENRAREFAPYWREWTRAQLSARIEACKIFAWWTRYIVVPLVRFFLSRRNFDRLLTVCKRERARTFGDACHLCAMRVTHAEHVSGTLCFRGCTHVSAPATVIRYALTVFKRKVCATPLLSSGKIISVVLLAR